MLQSPPKSLTTTVQIVEVSPSHSCWRPCILVYTVAHFAYLPLNTPSQGCSCTSVRTSVASQGKVFCLLDALHPAPTDDVRLYPLSVNRRRLPPAACRLWPGCLADPGNFTPYCGLVGPMVFVGWSRVLLQSGWYIYWHRSAPA